MDKLVLPKGLMVDCAFFAQKYIRLWKFSLVLDKNIKHYGKKGWDILSRMNIVVVTFIEHVFHCVPRFIKCLPHNQNIKVILLN